MILLLLRNDVSLDAMRSMLITRRRLARLRPCFLRRGASRTAMHAVVPATRITSICKRLVAVTGGATVRFLHLVTTILMIRKVSVILWRNNLRAITTHVIHVLFKGILYLGTLTCLAAVPTVIIGASRLRLVHLSILVRLVA